MMTSGTGWPSHPRRKVTEINCSTAPGHYLEDVPEISPGFRPGVVLISQDWQPEMYLMRKHDLWGENDYFEFAEKRLRELGILIIDSKESQE